MGGTHCNAHLCGCRSQETTGILSWGRHTADAAQCNAIIVVRCAHLKAAVHLQHDWACKIPGWQATHLWADAGDLRNGMA